MEGEGGSILGLILTLFFFLKTTNFSKVLAGLPKAFFAVLGKKLPDKFRDFGQYCFGEKICLKSYRIFLYAKCALSAVKLKL